MMFGAVDDVDRGAKVQEIFMKYVNNMFFCDWIMYAEARIEVVIVVRFTSHTS
jgi:hypothetical protein